MAGVPEYSLSRNGGGSTPLLRIDIPPTEIARLRREMGEKPQQVRAAVAAAINRALSFGRTRVANELRELVTAKRGNILRRLDITKATRDSMEGRLTILGRRIGLINFRTRVSRVDGVRVQIMQGGKVHHFRHAFAGVGLSQNKHIFEEHKGRDKRRYRKAHYLPNIGKMKKPLRAFYGVSLRQAFDEAPGLEKKIGAQMGEKLIHELDRQMLYRARKP
jgi:hypothetical protein